MRARIKTRQRLTLLDFRFLRLENRKTYLFFRRMRIKTTRHDSLFSEKAFAFLWIKTKLPHNSFTLVQHTFSARIETTVRFTLRYHASRTGVGIETFLIHPTALNFFQRKVRFFCLPPEGQNSNSFFVASHRLAPQQTQREDRNSNNLKERDLQIFLRLAEDQNSGNTVSGEYAVSVDQNKSLPYFSC